MLRNYLKVAIRTLWKNKGFSFINISGLAIGISTCLLISLYVLDELSYDTFHEKASQIYRLTEVLHLPTEVRHRTVTAPPMAPAIKENFPEVISTVRLVPSSRIISYQDKKFYDTQVWYADSTFYEIFSFPMVKGNPKTALVEPYSIVLTENAVKKYFGDEDPLGKSMSLSDSISLLVTGVIENIPSNSHLQFDVMLSRSTLSAMSNYEPETNWFNNGTYTYLLLPEGYDYKELEAKFPAFLEVVMAEQRKKVGLWYDFVLQPLESIHLRSTTISDFAINGNIKYVYTFSIVACLVLLIACANYINLSTAKSMNRAKELGMRKVVGARRKQLITQLLGESFLVAFIAFVLALVIATALLPSFNLITGKTLGAGYLLKPEILSAMIALFFALGIIAGAYPAIAMSTFSPLKTMKNYGKHGRENNLLRKGLVVFQFTMSIILIAGTILIFRQMNFLQNKNLGLDKDQILELRMRHGIPSKSELIKAEIVKTRGVLSASFTNFSYSESMSSVAVLPEGAGENEISSEPVISVDEDFLSTFKIDLISGRDFSKDRMTDKDDAFIINEAAVKHFNWGTPENALGKKLDWGLGKKGSVIGVVKDFNFLSLHETIKPLIIHIEPDWYSFISLKISSNNISETISNLETKWKSLNIDSPFDYAFLDDDFARLYKSEQQTQTIIGIFSGLAIFIASLGLFGLAAFTAEQRTKEIGVRKILGAPISNIIGLLSKDFLVLIAISILIAVPLAWYGANNWLQSFAYKTEISWWIFGIAGLTTIIIALITVSFQSIKAAIANPVDSLRSE